MKQWRNQRGVSLIEVLVALTMATVVIASVANLVSAVNRLNTTSGHRETAVSYTKQTLEVMADIANAQFACRCSAGGSCAGTTCTRTADSKSCTLASGYTSCWTTEPQGESGSDFALSDAGGAWDLVATSNPNGELIGAGPYSRKVTVTNVGGDSNVKHVVGTVTWDEAGVGKSVAFTTMLTAWKNL
jgi:prepilin-type N-terminal cleavage/methylation domain-containing protein